MEIVEHKCFLTRLFNNKCLAATVCVKYANFFFFLVKRGSHTDIFN